MKKPTKTKSLVMTAIAAMVVCFYLFDLKAYVSLDFMRESLNAFQAYYVNHRVATIMAYMAVYIAMAALSLPGAVMLTLLGGALFGTLLGTVLVSFASTIGATLAFLVSRFLFREAVQRRFKEKLDAINRGVEQDGGFYLFTLRLVPVFPFFIINLVMGVTPISLPLYYGASQIGMLPATFVYVNAGTQLAGLESIQGILSFNLLAAFALLGILPLVAKKVTAMVQARKQLAPYPRPKQFMYNLVVIGAGSAGLVSSYIAATVRAKVALVEADKMGGDCLNTGCVPSKALIRSAKIMAQAARAQTYGFEKADITFDFSKVMERVHDIIRTVEPHDSVERYTQLGVTCIKGRARVISPWEVEVNGSRLTTRSIVIATGARPMVPDIPGLSTVDYLTSDTVWQLTTLPRRLLVLGGGPIGCELSQAFARLGSTVTLVQRGPRILNREDPEVSELIRQTFKHEGVQVLTDHSAREIIHTDQGSVLVCDHGGVDKKIEFDTILIALGRVANTQGMGLKTLGLEMSDTGKIKAGNFMETNFPNIFCAGDVAGPYQFTHVAAHQSWYATVNALFGMFKRFRVDYSVIPWATYTDPEVARVGLNENEAKQRKIDHEVTVYKIEDLDRAITDSEARGFVKVITPPGKDRILGVTIVGSHAGDTIAEFVLAMRHGLGLNKILGTIHIYPTMAEANKYAAGQWKKAHAPEKILAWVRRLHDFLRT
ncbi:mercuric reductase (Hg(II) reductase) [Desulforapulum autotrophicum HRM2]|uniref:Mercuric reductase (Hg(II) reductase) n=1 Tax=Desulforapulum autotrophicum (strain ATCC 43914 / DSM 3382 / VKM B-1955 / HRM2) TaxID=177437 RepID=C0QIU5_DESAH|nr:bifunctional TVP38/TMEM64 family protein/FAD-dependent oxidoreductase [Desulforapulum autotrophicum]ACN13735.1 mercuric reductase (Hg(II) reductase) [Desulforapulum autotrophicum HRM2]